MQWLYPSCLSIVYPMNRMGTVGMSSTCLKMCSYVCLAQSVRVMLTCNLWVDFELVNGAMGLIEAICYRTGGPPNLPIAVMVHFDKYSGPTLHNGVVPITPIRRTWSTSGIQCSRLLKLAWAVTIYKSQSLTLDAAVICRAAYARP